MNVWGTAIRQQLQLRRMSRQHLARLARIDPGTVTHVLRGGHCSTDTLEKIARALEVNLAELFLPPGAEVAAEDLQDRLVAAVLRELSEDVGVAVTQRLQKRRPAAGPQPGDTPLPFEEA
jgi:transcriptional regulator with XRE-family HTH domain